MKAWYSTGIVVTSPLNHWVIKEGDSTVGGEKIGKWMVDQSEFGENKSFKRFSEKKRWRQCGGRVAHCCFCLGWEVRWLRIVREHSSHIIWHYPTLDDIESQLITFRLTLDNICPTFSLQHLLTFFSTFYSHLVTFFDIEWHFYHIFPTF